LAILLFPCNEFGGFVVSSITIIKYSPNVLRQEPGENGEIWKRVNERWPIEKLTNVQLMGKVHVKAGKTQHPVYKYLTAASGMKDSVSWNFAKVILYCAM
jgi:glutathione peroxidase-family protein